MHIKFIFSIVIFGLSSILLEGCSPSQSFMAVSKIGKVMSNPSVPVGQQNADKPSTAQITIYADKNANTSEYGNAPVDILVFQLKDKDELENADFYSLIDKTKASLETSYIRHMKKQVKPSESTVITPFKLTDDTNFIGVVVAYSNLDKTTWKAIEKVNPTGEQYKILIPITRQGVSVQVHR